MGVNDGNPIDDMCMWEPKDIYQIEHKNKRNKVRSRFKGKLLKRLGHTDILSRQS